MDPDQIGSLARLLAIEMVAARAASAEAQPGDILHERIKDAVDLCNAGSVRASLDLIDKLRRDEWPSASPRNRCRLLAASGFGHFMLGDEQTAIREFRSAHGVDFDRPGARALLALAQLLSGERECAFATAKQVLSDDPTCEQAATVLPVAASLDLSLANLEALIPEALLDKWDVLLGLVTASRRRGDEAAALAFAKKAHLRAPEDWRTCSTLAEELLGPVFNDEAIALTKAVPGALADRFPLGLKLLREAWERVKVKDHARGALHVAANLSAALAVSGDETAAEAVVNEGLQIRADDRTLLLRRAVILASRNDWHGMRQALSTLPNTGQEPTEWLLRGKAALMCGDVEGARCAAKKVLDGVPTDDWTNQLAQALDLEVALAAGAGAQAIKDAWDAHPDSLLLRSAVLDTLQADDDLRERAVVDVPRIAAGATDARSRAIAADVMAALGEYSQAADLFEAVGAPTDRDTPVLIGRLRSLLLADRRREARELFEAIATPVRERRSYLMLGIALYDRIGMLPRAIKLAEQHLGREPDDLRVRLVWVDFCERAGHGERTRARTWLSEVPATTNGSPIELMTLAQMVDHHLADPKCLRIGYRALRQGYDDPTVHTAYAFGLFLMGQAVRAGVTSPVLVGPDTAVTLEQDGDGEVVRVIETEPNPRLERDEVPPEDPFASQLLGLRVDDEFEIPSPGGKPRRFRVKLIEDKYLHAQRRCLSNFHRSFPVSQAFGTFKFDPEDGEAGVEPMLQAVRKRAEHVREVVARYKSGELPLAFAAKMTGSSVYDVWDGFRASPDVQFSCSTGVQAETEQADSNLQDAELCILDPLVPYSAVRLGIAGSLRASFPRMGITQSALDMLQRLAEERREERAGRRGSLSWTGDHYVMHEMTNDEVEARVAIAEDAMTFAARCELVPAEGSGSMVAETMRVYDMLPPAFLDAALAAQRPGCVLLCDDFALRLLAKTQADVRGVWTQAVLQHGQLRGLLEQDDYSAAVAELVRSGFSYVRVGAPDILCEFRRNDWKENDTGRELVRRLALPGNDPSSVMLTTRALLLGAWTETGGDIRFGCLAAAIARRFEEAEISLDRLDATLALIAAELRARALRRNSRRWLQTTSLVKPYIAERFVVRPAVRITDRIRMALGAGLRTTQS